MTCFGGGSGPGATRLPAVAGCTVVGVTDARTFLRSLVDRPLTTVTGRPNRVLRVEGDHVIVWTTRSPSGQPVPIAWVQDALDRLERDGEIEISVESVRYRSAFVGAALLALPGVERVAGAVPPRLRLTR